MSETTAVAKTERKTVTLAPEVEARIAENKTRNAVAAAIRGTVWSKDLSHEQVRAVAEYCRANGLDPVRHIEILGGRIYPTAALYEERAAPLIQRGVLVPHEPQFINSDERLDKLAAAGDAWAQEENIRRTRARIDCNAPEEAEAICIYRVTVAATGQTVSGVNWCGKGLRMESKEVWEYDKASGKRKPTGRFEEKDMDPVGGNEPTKTAITRAARRAWKQIVAVVPDLGAQFERIERGATVVEQRLASMEPEPEQPVIHGARRGLSLAAPKDGDDYYDVPADAETTEREPGEEG